MIRTALVLLVCATAYADDAKVLGGTLQHIEQESGGVLGVAALHIESGRSIGWRAKEHFPMMSVYKVPVALRALAMMEVGALPYRKMLRVEPSDFSTGFSPLRDNYPAGTVRTIGQLLEASVRDSDNTANDVLMKLSGGAPVVHAPLERIFKGAIRVDRSEKQMNSDFERVGPVAFDEDGRDSATPEAMVMLLSLIQQRKLLHPSTLDLMVRWMAETETGPKRIKGMLPAGTLVWHKTGTGGMKDGINLCTNDVGVISMTDGKGHIAIAVFLKLSTKDLETRERAIAETALAIYSYFDVPGSK